MCSFGQIRFAVRQPGAAQPPAHENVKLEVPLDLDALFDQGADDLDANDLALLELFSGPATDGPNGSSTAGPSNAMVMGQAVTGPAQAQPMLASPAPVLSAPAPVVPANAVQQLQFQAVMQHQAAIMHNPAAFPAAAQMYQQAMLQQQQAAAVQQQMLAVQQQAAMAAALPTMPAPTSAPQSMPSCVGKRNKAVHEVEEQTERIKKRRRESAQRSRQRKNAYMKSLEMENRALKMENERLRHELNKSQGGGDGTAVAVGAPTSAAGPKPSSGSVSRHEPSVDDCSGHGSDHGSMSEDEDLCDPILMAGSVAAELACRGCDPLDLLPTADLMAFVF